MCCNYAFHRKHRHSEHIDHQSLALRYMPTCLFNEISKTLIYYIPTVALYTVKTVGRYVS